MSGKILLDTNIVIALFAGEETVIQNLMQTEEVFVSTVVMGELYYGALKSSRITENLKKVDDFAIASTIIASDAETAKEYAKIKAELARLGRLIPENDIWIAAAARQYDLRVITRDEHFGFVPQLDHIAW